MNTLEGLVPRGKADSAGS